jgi:vacuolar-type H+-ATPase subunit E/Vma4
MGSKELIASLRQATEEKIRSMKDDAQSEAERIRSDVASENNRIREHYAKMQSREVREKTVKIFSEAQNRARRIKLVKEMEAAERLYSLALSSLHRLRNEGYRDVFLALTRELPPLIWEKVRVNPKDVALAKECFSGAEIIADGTIAGGIDALTEDGKVRVSNTFEKRLRRAWEDILPDIILDLYEEL